VLLDIRMPGMDGYEVCRRFKADERLRSIPIIFLSAFSESADKMHAFNAGGVDYVTKPFAEVEVLARSHTHLRLRRHQLHLEELVRQRINELAEAHRRLRIWDDAKTQWLNMLSHEMRTPLTGIFGIAEMLFHELPPGSAQHELHMTYDRSRSRIEKLMDDAFTLAQIDVEAENFAGRRVPLARVLRSAQGAVARLAPDIAPHVSVADVEHVEVSADLKLLERAFTDLLLTATHCVRAGEAVTVEAQLAAGQAKVTIATGGKSMSTRALETFFDVGGQRELLKDGGDFGLGAALASRILRLFNAHVSVRKGPERGIVMEISLPVYPCISLKEGSSL
jgi:DNA-binding response OmpR family regulator